YCHVAPLSEEVSKWVSVLRGDNELLAATTQKSRPSFPSQMGPRLYAGTGWPKRPSVVSPGTAGGRMGPRHECPSSVERNKSPPSKTKFPWLNTPFSFPAASALNRAQP